MRDRNEKDFFQNANWDVEDPILGHERRFLKKIEQRQPKKEKFYLRIAASIIFMIGSLSLFFYINQKSTVILSPETQRTQDYFSSIIEKEVIQLKSKATPKNQKVINDALIQLEILEKDYDKLKLEIAQKGEKKQIIYALLTNMQTRISFIQSVMEELENINQFKNHQNENTL